MTVHSTLPLRGLALPLAFATGAGLAPLACESKLIANADHCHNARGDQTCVARFGDQRRFCVGPEPGCDTADEHDGCVAKLPFGQCYSPCGLGTLLDEDGSCLAAAAGESQGQSGAEAGTDEPGEGDGDQPKPVCGDGEVEGDEECDDSNDIDDDDCTNACTVAVCGDGVVQAQLGEICDDGNLIGGDECTAGCELPGTVIWRRTHAFHKCTPYEVVLTSSGSLVVGAQCAVSPGRLLAFDSDGDLAWEQPVLAFPLSMAVGPGEEFAVVGVTADFQGAVATFASDGVPRWSANLPYPMLPISVAQDGEGGVLVVGASSGDRIVRRYSPGGSLEWGRIETGGESYVAVATNEAGRVWALRSDPARIETYTATGEAGWLAGTLGVLNHEGGLAVDHQDNAYALTPISGDEQGFRLDKFTGEGAPLWSTLHDEVGVSEVGHAVAVLPTGGALVAGSTNIAAMGPERDGLLSWYGPDGRHLQDAVYDGDLSEDGDELLSVTVSEAGDFAIAAGVHRTQTDYVLWLIKVAI